jgi:hypothetical protein
VLWIRVAQIHPPGIRTLTPCFLLCLKWLSGMICSSSCTYVERTLTKGCVKGRIYPSTPYMSSVITPNHPFMLGYTEVFFTQAKTQARFRQRHKQLVLLKDPVHSMYVRYVQYVQLKLNMNIYLFQPDRKFF